MAKNEIEGVYAEDLGDEVVVPEGMRRVGLCRDCRDFVELGASGECPAGHGPERIALELLMGKDEQRPHLPAMNLGALFMPALWGPAHGQMYLILMYPVWLFLDNIIYMAVHAGGFYVAVAIACLGAMAAFMVFYSRTANYYGYARVAHEKTVEEYLSAERKWAVAMGVIAVVFVVFATWYNLVIRPGLDV